MKKDKNFNGIFDFVPKNRSLALLLFCLFSGFIFMDSSAAWLKPQLFVKSNPVELGYVGTEQLKPVGPQVEIKPNNIVLVGEKGWAVISASGLRLGLSCGHYEFIQTLDRKSTQLNIIKGSISVRLEEPPEPFIITTTSAIITGESGYFVLSLGTMGETRIACHKGRVKISPAQSYITDTLESGQETIIFPATKDIISYPLGSIVDRKSSEELNKTMTAKEKRAEIDDKIDIFRPYTGEKLTLFDSAIASKIRGNKLEITAEISGAVADGPPDRVIIEGYGGRINGKVDGYAFSGLLPVVFGENIVKITAYRRTRIIGRGRLRFELMKSPAPVIEVNEPAFLSVNKLQKVPSPMRFRGSIHSRWPRSIKYWVEKKGPYSIRLQESPIGGIFDENIMVPKTGHLKITFQADDYEGQITRVEHQVYIDQ